MAGDPYFTNVAALLHFNGANGATTTTDSSGTPKAITFYGNAQISTAQSKFGGSSLYLDGSGDYLRLDTALDGLTAVTDKWTMEAWVYRTAAGTVPYVFAANQASSGANVTIVGADECAATGVTQHVLPSIPLNQWLHLAATYDGELLRVFHNGKAVGILKFTPAVPLADCVLGLGAEFDGANGGSPGNYFPGYIDDFRVTAGVARYTKDFAVPTAAFPDALGDGGVDPQFANVSALLHMDGANGNAVFTDEKGGSWTAAGNAITSTAQSKFGGSSGYFDGAGDEVYAANNDVAAASVVTLEAWAYIETGGGGAIFGQGKNLGASDQFLNITANRAVEFYKGVNVSGLLVRVFTPDGVVPLNQWTHIALVLTGSQVRIYVNGVQLASASSTSAFWANTGFPFRIGRNVVVNYEVYQFYFKGYLDDVRITKGVARYTGDFTPPTAPFPDSAEPTEGGGTVVVPVTRAWGFVS